MINYKLLMAYSGSNYLGFRDNKSGPTIESTLRNGIETLLKHPVKIQGASLTDSGVHAKGQVANFFSHKEIYPKGFLKSLKGLLPSDISALDLVQVDGSFHPSLDAKYKEYHYFICNRRNQLPFHRDFSWHVPLTLDLELMQKGAQSLIGKKDFSALANERYDDPIRHLISINLVSLSEDRLKIEVTGDSFLYKMVRNIVGTLTHVGQKKIDLESIDKILVSRDRRLAGMTAPAHGLYLNRVYYGS